MTKKRQPELIVPYDPEQKVLYKKHDPVSIYDKDQLKPKQRATFKMIRKVLGCDVLIAGIKAMPGAKPGDGLRSQLPG
jgi:hypothetical protein